MACPHTDRALKPVSNCVAAAVGGVVARVAVAAAGVADAALAAEGGAIAGFAVVAATSCAVVDLVAVFADVAGLV